MPRKLLSINTYHYRRGGADGVYLDHAALFSSIGWETGFFAMQHPGNDSSEWCKYFVNELEFGFDYSAWQKVKMAGKVIYSFEARDKLARLLDDWRPDIAHAHLVYHHISPSILPVLKSRNIPTVMTAHDLKIVCPAYKMLNRGGVCEKCKNGNLLHVVVNRCVHNSLALNALIFVESSVHRFLDIYQKNLDRVVVPSQFYEEKLVEWGWPREHISYIPNFVDTKDYQSNYDPGDYFLYFGRLSAEKGVATLISAAKEAGVKLRIAGTGPIEESLKSMALETDADIEFMGYCTGEKLRNLVTGCRAIVLPSEWYENAPISVLEAYASGKVAIGANIGGIPEMIEEGETGYVFQSGNCQQLADTLSRVNGLADAAIRVMGKAARDHVCRLFTPQRYLEDMLELYSGLGVDIPEKHASMTVPSSPISG